MKQPSYSSAQRRAHARRIASRVGALLGWTVSGCVVLGPHPLGRQWLEVAIRKNDDLEVWWALGLATIDQLGEIRDCSANDAELNLEELPRVGPFRSRWAAKAMERNVDDVASGVVRVFRSRPGAFSGWQSEQGVRNMLEDGARRASGAAPRTPRADISAAVASLSWAVRDGDDMAIRVARGVVDGMIGHSTSFDPRVALFRNVVEQIVSGARGVDGIGAQPSPKAAVGPSSWYVNVSARGTSVGDVSRTLANRGLRGWPAGSGGDVVACVGNDEVSAQEAARLVSDSLNVPAVVALVSDDHVLAIWLFARGVLQTAWASDARAANDAYGLGVSAAPVADVARAMALAFEVSGSLVESALAMGEGWAGSPMAVHDRLVAALGLPRIAVGRGIDDSSILGSEQVVDF